MNGKVTQREMEKTGRRWKEIASGIAVNLAGTTVIGVAGVILASGQMQTKVEDLTRRVTAAEAAQGQFPSKEEVNARLDLILREVQGIAGRADQRDQRVDEIYRLLIQMREK